MENIVYIKIGTENKIVELEEGFFRIICMYVKNPMEQAHWWERYKYYNELKKVVNQLVLLVSTGQLKKVILETVFSKRLEEQIKFRKLFLFLEEYHAPGNLSEEILGLFIMRGYRNNKWDCLEELIVELPQEEFISRDLEEALSEWIHLLSPTLNYLTIISDSGEQYEDLEQQLYEETGLMLQSVKDKKQLEVWGKNKKQHKGSKSLWLDLNVTKVNYRAVPRNCIYFDANNQKEKARTLGIKRPDVSYMSVMKFLDTIVDNIV